MIKAEDSAFPMYAEKDNPWGISHGLTKRELFAALVMQGFTADGRCASAPVVARWSVEFADALLAELEKGTEPNA